LIRAAAGGNRGPPEEEATMQTGGNGPANTRLVRTGISTFSKVLYIVTLYRKYTRALTLENLDRSLIHLLYHVHFQRSSFSEEAFVKYTGYSSLDRPSANRVCGWILSAEQEEQFAAPPGTTLLGLEFTQGDGHRDRVMRFTGPLSSVQHALASLSYRAQATTPSSSIDKVVHTHTYTHTHTHINTHT
jgi:hypothetical protein